MGVYPEVWVTWMHIYHVNKPCKLFFPQFSVSATSAKKAINNTCLHSALFDECFANTDV